MWSYFTNYGIPHPAFRSPRKWFSVWVRIYLHRTLQTSDPNTWEVPSCQYPPSPNKAKYTHNTCFQNQSNSWFSCECQGGMLEGLGTEVILSGWPQQIGWWRRGCWFMGKFVCCFRDSDRECMGWWSNYSSYETERSKKKRHFSYFKLSYILIHWWKILLVSLE